jgi:hypothetical protein
MDGKIRNRPTMLMNSVRPKSAVFKFKVWPQKRSQNLSCNPAQTLLHIWSSRRPNDVKFDGWKEKTISNNFHEEEFLKFGW